MIKTGTFTEVPSSGASIPEKWVFTGVDKAAAIVARDLYFTNNILELVPGIFISLLPTDQDNEIQQYSGGTWVNTSLAFVGPQGPAGQIAHVAYASDANGTGFTYDASSNLAYQATIFTNSEAQPTVEAFAGKWHKVKGEDGANGADGLNGTGVPVGPVTENSTNAAESGSVYTNTSSLSQIVKNTGYINTSGVVVVDSNWRYSDFIEVSQFLPINIKLRQHPSVYTISFYGSDKSLISGITGLEGSYLSTFPSIPNGAYFYRITRLFADTQQTYVYTIDLAKRNTITDNAIADVRKGYDYVDILGLATRIGYINTSGVPTALSDANWNHSDFIPIKHGNVINLNTAGHTVINAVSYYDINGNYISGVPYISIGINTISTTVPSGAVYARISTGSASNTEIQQPGTVRTFSLYENTAETSLTSIVKINKLTESSRRYESSRKLVLSPTDKIILYGDSISSTDYVWYKDAMEDITGAVVYNGGFSGYSAQLLAQNTQIQRIIDYNPNVIIVLLGGNDSGESQTVGTFNGFVIGEPIVTETNVDNEYNGTKYIQAVSHLMRRLIKSYDNIRTRANLTGAETEQEKETKIDAVIKPVIYFCTPLPQKRNNSSDPFSIVANWERKRDAIYECCQRYKVDCIDLYELLRIDMSAEPYWVSPTNKTTNNGVLTMDGLHPNKYGYRIISEIVCSKIM